MRQITALLGLIFALVIAAPSAKAENDFFAGKVVTIIAGLPPGGGVDGEMRVLAKYFSKFIPGRPTIVARNMPGAGGVVLGNFLNRATPDGLTLGMPGRSGFLLSNVVPQKVVSYDLTKFSYVGSAGGAPNALWISRKTQINSIADMKAAKTPVTIGALSPRSENAIVPRVLAANEHWPIKVVTGYPGFYEVLLAVERGEVDGLFTNEGSILNSRPDLIKSGLLKPIAQSFEHFPNVPVLIDQLTNPATQSLLGLVMTPSHIGLPLLGPPGIPADRLELLRRSYLQLMADEEYREEAERRGFPVGTAIGGAELAKLIAEKLSNVPEPVIKEYLAFSGLKADE